MYLEPRPTAKGAVSVSVDLVSTSVLSLEMELDKEVQRDAIQVGLAREMQPIIARSRKCGRNHWSTFRLSLVSQNY